MTQLFSAYLQAGFFSSVMILAVLLLRPFLRKAPRNTLCILWLLVALRLLLPFQLESSLSLQPRYTPATHTSVQVQPSPAEPVSSAPISSIPVVQETFEADLTAILSGIWIGGTATILLYTAISYQIIRRRVRDALPSGDNIWESHRIPGAFLLGYLKPQIYLPEGLHTQDRDFILAHEQTHIKRRDNWWKLLGMICVAFHWYNPLVWLSYWLLCRDIEVACDQGVIQDLSLEERKAYSFALLNSGKRMSHIIAYPVTFGEVNLKQRIKHVLSYRKPGFWITVLSVILVLAVDVCFLTVPKALSKTPATAPRKPEVTVSPAKPEFVTDSTEPEETAPTVTEPALTEPEETTPTETQPKETAPAEIVQEIHSPTEAPPKVPEPTESTQQQHNPFITDELRDFADRVNQSHGYERYNSDYSLF